MIFHLTSDCLVDHKQTWLPALACMPAVACMYCSCKDGLRKYPRKITAEIIDELEKCFESRLTICGKIYKPTAVNFQCHISQSARRLHVNGGYISLN